MRTWLFEVWNEPNLQAFWTGRQEGYFKLYGYTAAAIKSVDASLQVGGPATANNQWIPDFLDYCQKNALTRRLRQHAPLSDRRVRNAGGRHRHPIATCAAPRA